MTKEEFTKFLFKEDKTFEDVRNLLKFEDSKEGFPQLKPLITQDSKSWLELYLIIEKMFTPGVGKLKFKMLASKIRNHPMVEYLKEIKSDDFNHEFNVPMGVGCKKFEIKLINGPKGIMSENVLGMKGIDCIQKCRCYDNATGTAWVLDNCNLEGNAIVGIRTAPCGADNHKNRNIIHCLVEYKNYYCCPQLNCTFTKDFYEHFLCFTPFVKLSSKEVAISKRRTLKLWPLINYHEPVFNNYFLMAHGDYMRKVEHLIEHPNDFKGTKLFKDFELNKNMQKTK